MGCLLARPNLKYEEIALTEMEEQLQYNRVIIKDSDLVIRKNSSNNEITLEQFGNIAKLLKLKSKNTDYCPNLEEFYHSLLSPNNTFALKDILILAIFLGIGTCRNKARLIYEIYDTNSSHKLDSLFLSTLFDDISKVFIHKIHILIKGVEYNRVTNYEIRGYINNLIMRLPSAKQDFIYLISQGKSEVSLEDFKNVLETGENFYLLSSVGFRNFVSKSIFNA